MNKTPTQTPKNNHYWKFIFYILPLILVVVIGRLIQVWVDQSCAALPENVQGECGAGWLQLFFIPATFVASVLAWIVVAIGIIHFSIKFGATQSRSTKPLVIVLGSIVSVISFVGGIILTNNFIF